MTLPEKEPCLTPVLSSSSSSRFLPQAKTGLEKIVLSVKNMPFSAWDQHTPFLCPKHTQVGPRGTDSPLCSLSQERLRTVNSHTESQQGSFPILSLRSCYPPGEEWQKSAILS